MEQEVCVTIKNISFVPSREECTKIRIHFDSMDIFSDCDRTWISDIDIKEKGGGELKIDGCIKAVEGKEENFPTIFYSSIQWW